MAEYLTQVFNEMQEAYEKGKIITQLNISRALATQLTSSIKLGPALYGIPIVIHDEPISMGTEPKWWFDYQAFLTKPPIGANQ